MYKHGMAGTRPYRIWSHMKRRCYHKNDLSYKNYGARGIKICDKWLDFKNFWEDMKDTYFDKATIDRIDNDRGYSPDNCRWATHQEQMANKRCSRHYTYKGITDTIGGWERRKGVNRGVLRLRIDKYGYSFEEAIEKKAHKGKSTKTEVDAMKKVENILKDLPSEKLIEELVDRGYSKIELVKQKI